MDTNNDRLKESLRFYLPKLTHCDINVILILYTINLILIIYCFIKLKNGLSYVGDYKEARRISRPAWVCIAVDGN